MAAGGHGSMDYEQHPSITSSTDEFTVRPRFVRKKELQQYTCGICKDILLQPHQTVCGTRVCKSCIDAKFEGKDVIPCPLPHEDLDEEELQEEECQQGGLRYAEHVVPDPGSQRFLLKEKCFCKNFDFGCREKPVWKRLKDHQAMCQFVPVHCPNPGCPEKYALQNIDDHKARCGFMVVNCAFCKQPFRRKDMEEHINECEFADSQCTKCSKRFDRRKQLMVHQRIEPACLVSAGKCHYYDYCKFEAATIQQLANHLRTEKDLHLQSVTVKVHELEQIALKTKDLHTTDVKKTVNAKVKPLEKVTAEIAMNVKKLKDKLEASETNGEHLVNAMRTVAHSSQQIEQTQSKVNVIERQIKDSGLDRVTVIESHTQNIRRHNELLNDMEKRVKNAEFASYDGVLIWRISDYKRKKSDAVRGRQMSIYSYPFYTSRFGYKMCCRAYLNGDGLGRGKCLSLFFVVMRGEYDELLQFPFKQRVTFTLLCPSNPSQSKHETFMPDPDSSSFRRPQTEMNIASGCPQFALHSEVESSNFLVSDSIYIRVKVDAGGELFT